MENHTEVSASIQYRSPQLRCCPSTANASKRDLWPAGRWLLRENKMDCRTFVKDCLKAQWKRMIHGEKKLYRGNQPFHKKTLAGRMLAWSLKENTSWKNVTNLVFEMSGLASVPPVVRLYQVKAEGFAWLSQCDRPCNAGLTLQKETAHRSTSQPSSCDNQQNDTLSWRMAGKQEKKYLNLGIKKPWQAHVAALSA